MSMWISLIVEFVWKNKIPIFSALSAAIVFFNIGRVVGHWEGVTEGKAQAKTEIVTKTITVREKQNEIRNHRPDDAGVVKRLRDASF